MDQEKTENFGKTFPAAFRLQQQPIDSWHANSRYEGGGTMNRPYMSQPGYCMTVQHVPHTGHFTNRLRVTDTDYASDARVRSIDKGAFDSHPYRPGEKSNSLLALPPVDSSKQRRLQTLR